MGAGAEDAKEIAARLLQQTGEALQTGDFELFAECFTIPHVIETFEGSAVLNNRDELEKRFNSVRAYFMENYVTDLVRNILEAEFFDEDTIHSSHQTRVLSGTTLVQAPFPNLTVLKRQGGVWLAQTTQYAIADSDKHNAALHGTPSPERSKT